MSIAAIVLHTLRFSEAYFNAVRVGIAMYGLTPSPEMEPEIPVPLKEAFTLRSRLIHVKKLPKGEKVSYGATYEAGDEDGLVRCQLVMQMAGFVDYKVRKFLLEENELQLSEGFVWINV